MKRKVIVPRLYLREEPSMQSDIKDRILLKDEELDILEEIGVFSRCEDGWFCNLYTEKTEMTEKDYNNENYIDILGNNYSYINIQHFGFVETANNYYQGAKNSIGSIYDSGANAVKSAYGGAVSYGKRGFNWMNSKFGFGKKKKIAKDQKTKGEEKGTYGNYGIFGMPPSYLNDTDRIMNGKFCGRQFSENIITDGLLVALTPGVPDFLAELTDEQKEDALRQLNNSDASANDKDMITKILKGKDARYYKFKPAIHDYYSYVNMMIAQVGTMLGIKKLPKLGDILTAGMGTGSTWDWRNYQDPSIKDFFDTDWFDTVIPFFGDSTGSDYSENFSNETTQSMLAGAAKGLSDKIREAQFLTAGKVGEADMQKLTETSLNEAADPGLFSTLKDAGRIITSGGNLVFPDIWADSKFTKSISLQFKFQSPTGCIEDIFLYCMVPYLHLLCMAMPRQVAANGYVSPYLIRAYSKGWFNCDMGIIEDIRVQKGQNAQWSKEGYPLEIIVSVTIKDLYSSLSINNGSNSSLFFSNIGLMDHLCNMAGVNKNSLEPKRAISLFINRLLGSESIYSKARQKVSDVGYGVKERLRNSILGQLVGIGRS
jgi:hypothetical protein|nr:MAG TPA: hypothetical protein [Caudoviricetes sp.]